MSQKPVLGRGLASLFTGMGGNAVAQGEQEQGTQATEAISNRDRHPGISFACVEDIKVNPFQPRREFDIGTLENLAQSIKSNGIIQPLIVRKTANNYELIAGERRLRAAKAAGLKQVPIVIRRSTDREALELALIENIQRQNLNCIEEARAYQQLIEEFSLTQEEVAIRVGKDRTTVANHLRLLRLEEEVIADLITGVLTPGHGKALLGMEDSERRRDVYRQIIEKKLSVREVEALIEHIKANIIEEQTSPPMEGEGPPALKAVKERFISISQELTKQWSIKVNMRGTESRGRIIFYYSSREELDRLVEALQNQRI
ncbi:MAG: ParB/RepB/Spo0J family partition protein [Candidatus Poribacteria bacterium]